MRGASFPGRKNLIVQLAPNPLLNVTHHREHLPVRVDCGEGEDETLRGMSVNPGEVQASPRRVRFGLFEADLAAGELRRQGTKVRLSAQPFEVLAMLLARPGDVVTREDLRQRLWPADTYVDFDHGLNAAVNKLREALGDSAEAPRYVETLPRRGYRFIAPVNGDVAVAASVEPLTERPRRRRSPSWLMAAGLLGLAALAGVLAQRRLTQRSPSVPPPIRSVAVLPFVNLTPDAAEDYLAAVMTDALISDLAQIGSLRVISRTSVMQFKDTRRPLPEIGRTLDVDAIVEGTVLRSGERVLVSAKLVRASSDESLWAQKFERPVGDVLKLQAELADAIARQVRREVADGAVGTPPARWVNPDAYELYLTGRYYQDKQLGWATEKAVPLFERAIAKDPNFAHAYVGLAESLIYGYPPRDTMPRAKAAALRAIELDATLAEAHAALGTAQTFWDRDWTAAEGSFKRAIELEPSSSQAHHRYSQLLGALGRRQEALAHSRRALELDPLSSAIGHTLGRLLYFARDYPAAIAQYRRTLELDPQSYWAHMFLAVALEQTGAYREAATEWTQAHTVALAGRDPTRPIPEEVARVLAQAGSPEGYRALLRKRVEWEEKSVKGPVGSSAIAILHARLGEKEAAFRWLERSFESHTRDLIYLKVEPAYDSLRDDPRFDALLRRVGLVSVANTMTGRDRN
jgi:TolB-like protein/DNA-binding winged helix-turn-helix (wHTH) protein/Tfp pilus assembly protein PilF